MKSHDVRLDGNYAEWLPEAQAVLAQEITKENYDFGFIGVAKYDNVQIAEIAKQLPTVEQLQERIKMLEDELRGKAESSTTLKHI